MSAPPCIGDKIAFKVLELTSSYTPAFSSYKFGTVTNFNVQTNCLVIQLNNETILEEIKKQESYSEGKFSIPETDSVDIQNKLEIAFSSLIDPKLLV